MGRIEYLPFYSADATRQVCKVFLLPLIRLMLVGSFSGVVRVGHAAGLRLQWSLE